MTYSANSFPVYSSNRAINEAQQRASIQQPGYGMDINQANNILGQGPGVIEDLLMNPYEATLLEASAINVGSGLVVRQDYNGIIGDYRRKDLYVWSLIPKVPATAPLIVEQRRTLRPQVSFVPRGDFTSTPIGQLPPIDQADPGQALKCLAGVVETNNFELSMLRQQMRLFGDMYGQQDVLVLDTVEMLEAHMQIMEKTLIVGDATANPYEFNGIKNLIPPGSFHNYLLDETVPNPSTVARRKLIELCQQATSSRTVVRKITHILCSPAGSALLQRETEQIHLYYNQVEIIPGITVSGLRAGNKVIPIIESIWCDDTLGAHTGEAFDSVVFYLCNFDQIMWHGLVPAEGMVDSYEPQVFDVRYTLEDGRYLVNRRMVMNYGTLHARNVGQSFFSLRVRIPLGFAYDMTV